MKRAERGGAVAWLLGIVVLVGLVFAGYVWFVLHWSYSQGERAGWVQKLSHKGWFCKTWEGELAMIAVPGALPEKFFFTVWDDDVAERINRHMGQRVALHYEEKVGIPTDCFGESRYIVTRVTTVDGAPPQPGAEQPVPGAPAATPPASPPATPSTGPASSPVPGPVAPASPPAPAADVPPGTLVTPIPQSPAPEAGAAAGAERRP